MMHYPLQLRARAEPKVWGGRNLERVLGKTLPPGKSIGETWEAGDPCVIENGAHRGKTLAELIEPDAEGIVGTGQTRLPLLFKFIDAQDDLSVQVHPDDAHARALEDYPFGKTEAWYILDAAPGARVYVGFKRACTPAQVRAAIANQTLVDLLAAVTVQRGDVVLVSAGTVHAIGAGIVLAEIQQNSDTTYRLYDWGRSGRELHIEKALAVARFVPIAAPKIPTLTIRHATHDRALLVACRYFALELWDLRGRADADTRKFQIVAPIEGAVKIHFGRDVVAAHQGQTIVLPARLGAYALEPMNAAARVLKMYVPDLQTDVVQPLKKAGFAAAEIVGLGGADSERNDLAYSA